MGCQLEEEVCWVVGYDEELVCLGDVCEQVGEGLEVVVYFVEFGGFGEEVRWEGVVGCAFIEIELDFQVGYLGLQLIGQPKSVLYFGQLPLLYKMLPREIPSLLLPHLQTLLLQKHPQQPRLLQHSLLTLPLTLPATSQNHQPINHPKPSINPHHSISTDISDGPIDKHPPATSAEAVIHEAAICWARVACVAVWAAPVDLEDGLFCCLGLELWVGWEELAGVAQDEALRFVLQEKLIFHYRILGYFINRIFVDPHNNIKMYLPSFYKVKFEKYFATTKRFAPFGVVAIAWVTWTLWPQLYNTIYTDFIPPARGVQRRVIEDV